MSGWIKLHRNLKDWEWYDDHNATRLLVHLLITVNYEDKKWKGIIIKAGQLITSYDHLGSQIGLSKQQVKTSLKKLQDSGEITRERTRHCLHISLVKWDKLQSKEPESNPTKTPKETRKKPESNPTITPTKEVKKLKETKEDKKTVDFDLFWNMYNKKVGDKKKVKKKWDLISSENHKKIIEYLPLYIESTPDKQFRKNPQTFLNNSSWNDEIINSSVSQGYGELKTYSYDDMVRMNDLKPGAFKNHTSIKVLGGETVWVKNEDIEKFNIKK